MKNKILNLRGTVTLLLLCTLLGISPVLAQQTGETRTLTGQVTDEANETLIGASIVVKGTTIGTVTDFNGNYSLTVPSDASELLFSYVGYNSKSVTIPKEPIY